MTIRTSSLRRNLLMAVVSAALVGSLAPLSALAGEPEDTVFNATGAAATWTVPADVYQAIFELGGAAGGGGNIYPYLTPGSGTRATATLAVTPGEVLQINVGMRGGGGGQGATMGTGGWNGGGVGGRGTAEASGTTADPFWGGGGGGATDVRRGSSTYRLEDRILVAAGGGGNSHQPSGQSEPRQGVGGDAGKLGEAGTNGFSGGAGACTIHESGGILPTEPGQGIGGKGGGGGSAAGGSGGAKGDAEGVGPPNTAGTAGSLGQGGTGGDALACSGRDSGGGGGGGWHGGGGGGGASTGNGGGGGGGGSSFGPSTASFEVISSLGNGFAKITWTPEAAAPRPDARVRRGTTGPWTGNNLYNTTATDQALSGSAARGSTITFQLSLQNDGTLTEQLRLKATGTSVQGYTVTYASGSTDITSQVVAGTWRTPSRAPGTQTIVTVRVSVKQNAAVGSQVVRKLIVSSVTNGTIKDAAKITGRRS